jgi:hypothetical protein
MLLRLSRANRLILLNSKSPLAGVCLLFAVLISTTSCSDYESGYKHGYDNLQARDWLVFGRAAYKKGYKEGQMQVFQDSWYAENADDIDSTMSCPAVVMKTNQVISTSAWLLNEIETAR